jgi:hypothetical protein
MMCRVFAPDHYLETLLHYETLPGAVRERLKRKVLAVYEEHARRMVGQTAASRTRGVSDTPRTGGGPVRDREEAAA